MQLGIFDNNTLVEDITYQVDNQQVEFSTAKYGFGYLKVKTRLTLPQILSIYNQKKVYTIRLATGARIFWEGRLEDVEIRDNPTLVAYGFWRSLTDLQVTDLWSTTDYKRWQPTKREQSVSLAYDDKSYNFSTDRELFIGAKQNTAYGNSPTSNFGSLEYYLPSGYLRGFQSVSFLSSGNLSNSFVYGMTFRGFPGDTTAYGTIQPTTGNVQALTGFVPDKPYAQFYYARLAANALFVGEDNTQYGKATGLRIGTTPSISGARLYADEILKFYCSGVYNLNNTMISQNISFIRSPQYDLTDIEFKDVTALDVVDTLLKYPSISGVYWRFQIWENKIPYFEPKTARNTWYANFTDIRINRSFDKVYTQDRVRYTTNQKIDVTTPYYTLQTWGTQRQSTSKIDGLSISLVQTAKRNDALRKERIEVHAQWLRGTQGERVPSYYARAGDQIIFVDLPGYLTSIADRSFLIDETIYNMETGITRLVPEQPTLDLDTLLSKVKT